MKCKITQQDIAREIGVSVGTVDRAIHGRPGISPKTKQKIVEYITKNSYTPDRIASTLARKATNPRKIGVILESTPEFFWDKVRQGVLEAGREFADFGFEIELMNMISLRSTDEVRSLFADMIHKSVDAIVIVPSNDDQFKKQIAQAVENGINVITLNDDIELSKRLFYVGPQMRQSGRIAGEFMGRYLNGQGNVIIINGSIESVGHTERIEGFKEVINSKYDGICIHKVHTFCYESMKESIELILDGILERDEDIAGIYDADGASLCYIGDHVKSRGLQNRFMIIGHEIWDRIEQLIAEDVIQVCINQDPFTQGYYAIKLLANYLYSGLMPLHDRLYTRVDIIIKENLISDDSILNPFMQTYSRPME